ncbi:hypothetical protein EFA69_01590 [Rufibacter immobilis]|uniref:Transposase IS200-like domain-containing protein n=1 Tax=Rufibacter immobilis TaxID=1348778 RepID=A0A3M9N5V6_9BACT|nr:hypothetical protein [Rufibacter immobilis]RNI33139.1 hypothetical protein EFA69_01590 [Rufibacter immobilis]
MMQQTKALEPGKFYHLYTSGNNGETVFVTQENYFYFLQLYRKYVAPFVNTFCYCMLPNHVHFLVQVKEEQYLFKPSEMNQELLPVTVQRQLSHLLNAFTKAMNTRYGRSDSLFQKRFRRKEVTSEAYFTRLVFYIHFNPQHHGLIPDFKEWPYSSYHSLLSKSKTNLERNEVLSWFGGAHHFKLFHQELADFSSIHPLIEEDDL